MPKRKPAKKTKASETAGKTKKESPFRAFRLTRKRDLPKYDKPLPNPVGLVKETVTAIKDDWRLFGGLTLIYVLLLWFINGFPSQGEYVPLKDILIEAGTAVGVGTIALGAFSGLLSNTTNDLQQFASTIVSIIFLLCFIWLIRHRSAGNETTIRETLYNAPAPLIGFILVGVWVALHILPGAIGLLILSYSLGFQGELLRGLEAMLFSIGGLLLVVLSVYLLLHSTIALVIVTLPNMYPIEALRSAKRLVLGRRLQMLLRLSALFFITIVFWMLVLVPIVYLDLVIKSEWFPLVPLAASLLAAFTIPFSTVYLYRLYRALL